MKLKYGGSTQSRGGSVVQVYSRDGALIHHLDPELFNELCIKYQKMWLGIQ
ncbi:hypothetical protein EXN66_Car005031 [Channa argus]|uniref:Uncharacterized protein n=1 Tax=Channa argus TaxID=215402 RepID=A0A6G1PGM6_CHAAH|nr:hypothetical protein EXN66_Car005031 [Channa argus]